MTYLEQNHEVLNAVRDLTPPQKRILFLLTLGYQNKVIAAALGVTESTVKAHMTRILDVLCCTNRTQAALIALCLQNQLRIDEIVGHRRVVTDKHILTDQQLDMGFLGGDTLHRQLRLHCGSDASTC
jgi:DNA-binding CsgD family transcriptional regulator